MPYDPDSGLVFSEKTIKNASAEEHKRSTACRGSRPQYVAPLKGPQTLVDVAMRKILCNLDMLDDESLSTLPSILLQEVWNAILRSQLDSLRVWKLFARSSFSHEFPLYRWGPLSLKSMDSVLLHSLSATCTWVVNLEVTNHDVTPEQLVAVSRLDNLRVFNMATHFKTRAERGFHDRILRAWADAARETGALSKLRFLFLYNQSGVTKWSLPHLEAFPSLDEFCSHDCGITRKDVEQRRGFWRRQEDSFYDYANKLPTYEQKLLGNAGTRHVCYIDWNTLVTSYVGSKLNRPSDDTDRRPTLPVSVDAAHSISLRMMDVPSAIVCLKLSAEPHPIEEEVRVENRDKRPLVKKRKIVVDSSDFNDMIGG